MKDGNYFLEKAACYFAYLENEFGFNRLSPAISGNRFYEARYSDGSKMVSISYDYFENDFVMIVQLLENGVLPNYDDKRRTLHLNVLNKAVFPKVKKEEILLNAQFFAGYKADDEVDAMLLTPARELRLCMKYFDRLKFDAAGVLFMDNGHQ